MGQFAGLKVWYDTELIIYLYLEDGTKVEDDQITQLQQLISY